MTIDHKIRDEKLSALSSFIIKKYKYITGEWILPSDQSRIIKKAKFSCSPLGKILENQIKAIENKVKKQLLDTNEKSFVSLVLKYFLTEEAIHELTKIKEIDQKTNRFNS